QTTVYGNASTMADHEPRWAIIPMKIIVVCPLFSIVPYFQVHHDYAFIGHRVAGFAASVSTVSCLA
ncbi:MAG TPA: hypothetical protein VN639_16860, partial [Azonexus sp.]|nr:hypothetical protein [Azonexus sp.]